MTIRPAEMITLVAGAALLVSITIGRDVHASRLPGVRTAIELLAKSAKGRIVTIETQARSE